MKYVLRYNHQEFALPVGEFVIGRAATCQLSLDDPLVSRNHAVLRVTEEAVTLEDLGSRNGVKVNGQKISTQQRLMNGDGILIGTQELKVTFRREGPSDTLVQQPTHQASSFGLMGVLADKALGLGRGDEAERLIGPLLKQMLGDLEAGRKLDTDALQRACDYAAKIAGTTGDPAWVDYIFRAYATTRRPCPASLVDQLYEILRKVKSPALSELRRYLGLLREGLDGFGPAERFLVNRLEGLERLVSAR